MSKNFNLVKNFYDQELWTPFMIRNAVGRWITVEEYMEIAGEEYEKDEV